MESLEINASDGGGDYVHQFSLNFDASNRDFFNIRDEITAAKYVQQQDLTEKKRICVRIY